MKSKLLSLALLGLLLVFFWTNLVSATTDNTMISVEDTWNVHRQDTPIMSPILADLAEKSIGTDAIGESVTYGQLDNYSLKGYLARPSNIDKPLPALIVIHEWWGLNDNIKEMTKKLAGEGYTALAVDLYDGNVADNPIKAKEFMTAALKNTDKLNENLKLAYQYLEQEQKAPKIASIGWCFGGTWSLQTALLFPKQLKAAVIYYGGGIETNPEKLKPLEMPVLGIFGELDENPPVSKVKEFETALKSLGKSVEIYIYPNASHAFANPSGTRYNASAAKDAMEKTVTFLHRHLQQ